MPVHQQKFIQILFGNTRRHHPNIILAQFHLAQRGIASELCSSSQCILATRHRARRFPIAPICHKLYLLNRLLVKLSICQSEKRKTQKRNNQKTFHHQIYLLKMSHPVRLTPLRKGHHSQDNGGVSGRWTVLNLF